MKIDWRKRKLIEICDLVRGSEPGSTAYIKESTDTIPFLRIGDLSGKVNKQKFISKKLKNITIVNPSEILITFDGSPGIVTKGWNGAISSGIRIVRNIKRDEILKDFLFYYLQTPTVQEIIRFYSIGITILHASRSIPHIKIKIPPLSIQQKIVKRLDTIRKAQELNKKQISLANELFQSLLHQELKPQKNWEIKRIKDVSESITYGISISVVSNLDLKNGVPIITMADITEDNQIDFNKVRKIKLSKNNIKKFKLEKGDLLFNWRNASRKLIGKTSIFNKEITAVNASFLLKIKCNEFVLNYYLYFYLNYLREIGYFKNRCKFSANNTINASELKLIKIFIPPVKIQHQIVKKLSAVQEYKKKLLKQKELLQELFKSTLDKAMKGELVR